LAKANILQELKKFKIIDSHMHFGVSANTLYYKYSDDRVMQIQKECNVETSICSHVTGIFGDLDSQIEEVIKNSKKFKSSIYWQLVYIAEQSQKSLDIIEKYKSRINFAGIKIFSPGSGIGLDNRAYYPLWEYAVANDIVVGAHTWSPYTENPSQIYANPLLFESVLRDFPALKVLLIHSGGKIDFYDEVIEFVRKHETVYMDFSGDCFYPPVFKKVIDRAGRGRSLFGTDMPMMDTRYHIANVISADISDSDKADIFYNNAAELFKINK